MRELTLVILAAGKGTRLKSRLPKVLHCLAGKPLLEYVVEAARPLSPQATCVIVGHEAGQVQKAFSNLPVEFIVQEPQLGTGHALLVARPFWESHRGDLLVLYGDVPLISTETLAELVEAHNRSGASATLMSTVLERPEGYGRVLRSSRGDVESIVEEKDATPEQREIQEINTGIYCFQISALAETIGQLSSTNSQQEYYLTDCIGLLKARGRSVGTVICSDPMEVCGVNSRLELSQLEGLLRNRKLEQLMRDGVTVIDPASTYVEPGVQVGVDTVLYPNVFLEKGSVIGSGCQIYPNVRISASVVDDQVVILDSCLISESRIHSGSQVGPFAHLRNHAVVGKGCRIGNFVEIKNSKIGDRTKAAHLSYLGDAEVGEDVNIGAGTITCNYDGIGKNKTIIEDDVFVGSDSQLIAPVTIHRGAYIAAGSTIQQDVPEDALAIARSHQVNKEHWARKRRDPGGKE
jgi:bifunctional UDP-N-acetylglucosamine pyrophosphorylase / glucosamine-1-phosphate N-acetyltransferase